MTKYTPPAAADDGAKNNNTNQPQDKDHFASTHQHGLRGLSEHQRTLSQYPQSVLDVRMQVSVVTIKPTECSLSVLCYGCNWVHIQEHPTVHVRLSGQDCIRGTFNQRSATRWHYFTSIIFSSDLALFIGYTLLITYNSLLSRYILLRLSTLTTWFYIKLIAFVMTVIGTRQYTAKRRHVSTSS